MRSCEPVREENESDRAHGGTRPDEAEMLAAEGSRIASDSTAAGPAFVPCGGRLRASPMSDADLGCVGVAAAASAVADAHRRAAGAASVRLDPGPSHEPRDQ